MDICSVPVITQTTAPAVSEASVPAEAVEEAASEVLEEALLAAVEPEADSDKSTKNTISVSDYEAVVP